MTPSIAHHRKRNAVLVSPSPTIADYLNPHSQPPPLLQKSRTRPESSIGNSAVPGLVSIVTTCFNSAATIDRAINSVRKQSYPDVEYIVIDGASTDGTIDKLLAAADIIDLLISESDRGISDAFNKGIAMSRGEFLMLVNSDDWLEPDHLTKAVACLKNSDADYVFGDLIIHFPNGSPAHIFAGDPNYAQRLTHSMPAINHPTVVCRRRAFESFGLFNLALRIAMDYEWFLRVDRMGGRGLYVKNLVSHMALGGASVRSFKNSLGEVRDVSIDYGYPAPLAWSRFALRVLKRSARLILERICSNNVYEWLRRRTNADYRTVDR